jgi:FlaA1/EpsC-like NDP-sugar epimerase
LDLSVVVAAIVAAYWVRFEGSPPGPLQSQMALVLFVVPIARLLAGRVVGAHRSSWRLFGLAEGMVLARAVVGVSGLLVLARFALGTFSPRGSTLPFGIIALEGLFSAGGLLAVRLVVRMRDEQQVRRSCRYHGRRRRALLVGAGRAGRLAASELRARPDAGYEPVGFLDDDPARLGQVIDRVRVRGCTRDARAIADELGAEAIILTMPSSSGRTARAVVDRCRAASLPMFSVPGMYELLAGTVEISKIRPLRLDDVLGRDVVGFDDVAPARVQGVFGGKRIVVTGGGGSIGSELCRQLAALAPESLIVIDNHETHLFEIEQQLRRKLGDRVVPCLVDIRERSELEEVFAEHRPHAVLHAAAYKHVPMMEAHPCKAVLNNVRGTRLVAETAVRFGVERFLLVSTDKAVDPTSVMGATKRAAEFVALGANTSTTRFSAVRFGNVLGSAGSVVHTFQRQIEAGGPVTLTHPEVTRFFMTIPEAVSLVLQAASVGEGGDLFVLNMGEPVRILDLAHQMIQLAGFDAGEIAIDTIGLRAGEKLHEEVLGADETKTPSGVPNVSVVRGVSCPVTDVSSWVRGLEGAAVVGDVDYVRSMLSAGTGYRGERRAAGRAATTAAGDLVDVAFGA